MNNYTTLYFLDFDTLQEFDESSCHMLCLAFSNKIYSNKMIIYIFVNKRLILIKCY